uniref:Uncharacterized protein n=1 Tax=viral metagenome TaxID=1070528 RepID=A0A6C0JP67_9ZZZZ
MKISSNFKKYVLIGLLLFFVLLFVLFYCNSLMEGFQEGAETLDSAIAAADSKNSKKNSEEKLDAPNCFTNGQINNINLNLKAALDTLTKIKSESASK